jgi:hypothetical protein
MVTPCDIFGGQSSTETGFIANTLVSPLLSFHQFCILIHSSLLLMLCYLSNLQHERIKSCDMWQYLWLSSSVVLRIVGPLSALHSSETQCTGHVVT